MAFTLAVTQAPHASFYNGGSDSGSRQYFARPTQSTPNGPRIASAISGISPGEFRTIWADATGDIFRVRLPTTGATFATVDWNPRGVWDPATEQIILGGRRGLTKYIAYSDVTGDWRELPMPLDGGRIIQGTSHFYGMIVRDNTGQVYVGNNEPVGKTWRFWPAQEVFTRRADHITTNGGNGSMFAWSDDANSGAGGLFKYAGDAQRWLAYDPATDTWTNPANNLGNGPHALVEYNPVVQLFLVVGGTNTATRAMTVTHAGVATQVADVPQEISMNDGSWIVAHPSGCWLVRAHPTTGDGHVFAYWSGQNVWQDLGVAPDLAQTYPTAVVDYDRDVIYIVSTTGLYAYGIPDVAPPGGGMIAEESGTDAFAAAGDVIVQGTLAATESGADTLTALGGANEGDLIVTESGADTFAATGAVPVAGDLDATESGADGFLSSGGNVAIGSMAAAESGADAFSASGTVAFQPAVGDLAAAETGADTASILGSILVAGLMAAAESGTDLASVLGPVSFKLSARRKRMKNVIPYRRPKATS